MNNNLIEENIIPLVDALNEKSMKTRASCHGHFSFLQFNIMNPYVVFESCIKNAIAITKKLAFGRGYEHKEFNYYWNLEAHIHPNDLILIWTLRAKIRVFEYKKSLVKQDILKLAKFIQTLD